VAGLRGLLAAARPAGNGADPQVGLAAARRAARYFGPPLPPGAPLAVQLVPPPNIAVGTVPWGLAPWLPPASVRAVSTGCSPDDLSAALDAAPRAAAGRPLIIVVRDAHRYRAARTAVGRLLAARPDAVLAEMGLPGWRPAAARSYLATYGASASSGRAAAELLGLAAELLGLAAG